MARRFTWLQTTTLRRNFMLTRHLNRSVQGEKVRSDESHWSGGQCIYPMFSPIQNLLLTVQSRIDRRDAECISCPVAKRD